MWREGSFPQEWKSSTIIPIHKAGKDPTDPKNYRPISLTSNVCKLVEKMINARLKWFLEKNQKLSPQQYGFRQERTTMDPIAALTTDILNGLKNWKTTTAVFFDFEKAFDTIIIIIIITTFLYSADNMYHTLQRFTFKILALPFDELTISTCSWTFQCCTPELNMYFLMRLS